MFGLIRRHSGIGKKAYLAPILSGMGGATAATAALQQAFEKQAFIGQKARAKRP
jgi:hypothetical protein